MGNGSGETVWDGNVCGFEMGDQVLLLILLSVWQVLLLRLLHVLLFLSSSSLVSSG